MIIDFHTHIFPERLAQNALLKLGATSGIKPHTQGTAASLMQSMRAAGVAYSVLCNIVVKPEQTQKTNEFAASFLDYREGERAFVPFAGLHPADPDWMASIDDISRKGFKGIKIHPDYHGVFIDDPIMIPIFEEIARRKLILLLHTGVDIGLPPPFHATPERLANVMPYLERCSTVIAHMGGHEMFDKALELLCGRNVYFDTSYSLFHMDIEVAKRIVSAHGIERMLFATDSPWVDQSQAISYVENVFAPGFLSPEHKRMLLAGNAAKLLGV